MKEDNKLNQSNNTYNLFHRKTHGYYPNTLPAFTQNRIVSCNENLGNQKPRNYPAKYWVDDQFPVFDVNKNTKIIE
jgi:hypothetical protein